MFDSIRKGFGFLGQAVDMARRDPDLLKPSFYALVAGLAVTLVWVVPLAATVILGGDSGFASAAVYALSAGLIFSQYAVAYVFSGMTAYLVFGYLGQGDGRMDRAWAIVRRDVWDLLSLAAASTLVKLVENALRGRNRRGGRSSGGDLVASILDRVWTTATYFVLPAMVIEDLGLGGALKRATQIVKNNLLLVAVTSIGVSGVVNFIRGVLIVLSIVAGMMVFAAITAASTLAAIVLGTLVGGGLVAAVSAFTSYLTTAYHTCMFLWARDAEKAVAAGRDVASVPAPAPLAAVLG